LGGPNIFPRHNIAVPIYVVVGRGANAFTDRVSTIFFPSDFEDLLRLIEEKFGTSYPTLLSLFRGQEVEPSKLLDEALDLLQLLKSRADELPCSYFFAVLPKDFEDVASLLGGGASGMVIPGEDRVYKLVGGFGRAELRDDKGNVEKLEEGAELTLGAVRVKVFTRPAYEAAAGPLKTLIVASLIAMKKGAALRVCGVAPDS